MINIVALMENKPSANKALHNKHGLSLLVNYNGMKLLFDCGYDDGFVENAYRLGINLEDIDCVILSHNHYDHAAGLKDFIDTGYDVRTLVVGKDFFDGKYVVHDGGVYTNIGSGLSAAELIKAEIDIVECDGAMELAEGAYLICGFPKRYDFETVPERFVRRTEDGFVQDDFHDELALALDSEDGLVLVVGCAHPGILNMIAEVERLFRKKVVAVIGGTHLKEADDERVAQTAEILNSMNIKMLGLCHCTGAKAEEYICNNVDGAAHIAVGDEVFI